MRDSDPTLQFPVLSGKPLLPPTAMTLAPPDAEMAVEQSSQRDASSSSTLPITKDRGMTDSALPTPSPTQSSQSSFPFPSTPGASSTSHSSHTPGAPDSVPHFPSPMAPRDPPPLFASPSSPPESSNSPPSRAFPSMTLPRQPFPGHGFSPLSSPWASLAAASGAPTPSLDGPGRNSPHLGGPFEQLNIGGSWSGGNLWAEGSTTAAPTASRKRSLDPGMVIDPDAHTSPRRGSADSSHRDHRHSSGPSTSPSHRPFLPAVLAKRRASLPKTALGTSLSPNTMANAAKAPSPLASSSTSSPPSSDSFLKPLSANKLEPLISRSTTLILDLRPPSAYRDAHIPDSHSVPLPSTLLRRPAFSLERLAGMLSTRAKDAVSKWREKDHVILLDSDSTSIPANGTLEGVAGKFDREGFKGDLWYVRGGFVSVRKLGINLVSTDDREDESPTPPDSHSSGGLVAGKLSKLAFQQASTGSNLQNKVSPDSTVVPTTPGIGFRDSFFGSHPDSLATERPSHLSLKNASPRSSSSLGRLGIQMESLGGNKTAKFQPANPFFDNIRQNLELSHGGGGGEKITLNLPPEAVARTRDLPPWLADLATLSKDDCAERLAEEFLRVELGEQKRLQAIMDWHSKTSGAVVVQNHEDQRAADKRTAAKLSLWAGAEEEGDDYFPYSITAGIERGTKNRYKNIWPYDFSRVRLESPPDEDGDYINASFVQPMVTSRRYIATQGPLDSTYRDFWMLVWEQGVSVIVMLTKQYEGGSLKCGNYWEEEQYGPIIVHLESTVGGEDTKPDLSNVSGFDFGTASAGAHQHSQTSPRQKGKKDVPPNIKRTFVLRRTDKDEPPRKVVQIQCCSWPDFDVPESPSVLLNLLDDVDKASFETCKQNPHDRAEHPPVLVHCSAGVGRTGSFIIVDAILDSLRREREEQVASPTRQSSQDTTDSADSERLLHPNPPDPLSSSTAIQSMLDTGSGPTDSGSNQRFRPKGPSDPASSESLPSVLGHLSSPAISSPLAISAAEGQDAISLDPKVPDPSRDISTSNPVPALESQAEKMDVDQVQVSPPSVEPEFDPSEDAKRKTIFANTFTRHRGGTPTSVDSVYDSDPSEGGGARPSLVANGRASSGNVSRSTVQSDMIHGILKPTPIVKSTERHRKPCSLAGHKGLSPVAVVLEGMRTQRMSLVQSLRQYIFVHRAIIEGYLNMVDEDRQRGLEKSSTDESIATPTSTTTNTTSTSASADTMSGTLADDDWNQKRRASPTELLPENAAQAIVQGASGLSKRPSFKKMRRPAHATRTGSGLRDLHPSTTTTASSSGGTPEIPEEAIVIDTSKHHSQSRTAGA